LAGIIIVTCGEALDEILSWLITEYPEFFNKEESKIENKLTGEIFDIADSRLNPLEVLAEHPPSSPQT
jgi:hypothetical protein